MGKLQMTLQTQVMEINNNLRIAKILSCIYRVTGLLILSSWFVKKEPGSYLLSR